MMPAIYVQHMIMFIPKCLMTSITFISSEIEWTCGRYFRNRLKSAITNRLTMQDKVLTEKMASYHQQLEIAKADEKTARQLSESIDILVNWMQHDVLNKAGVAPESRYELFAFVLSGLNTLALQHPHRIEAVCTTLKNQKHFLLAFTGYWILNFNPLLMNLFIPSKR